jgi:hypothetical protein
VHPVYRVYGPRGGGGSPVHHGLDGGAGVTPHRSGARGLLKEKGLRGTSPWSAVGGTGMERGR